MLVKSYEYKAGRGAQILDASGTHVIATVSGTSYPVGSACQADVDLARVMAAGPEMLAALKALVMCNAGQPRAVNVPMLDDARAAIAKAVQS